MSPKRKERKKKTIEKWADKNTLRIFIHYPYENVVHNVVFYTSTVFTFYQSL